MSNQTQSTTQEKRVDSERKLLKAILTRVVYMAASTFQNQFK